MKFLKKKRNIVIIIIAIILFLFGALILKFSNDYKEDKEKAVGHIEYIESWFDVSIELEKGSAEIDNFLSYLYRRLTFQKINYSQFLPDIHCKVEVDIPEQTETSLYNLNMNLLYNPVCKEWKTLIDFNEPITVDYLANNTEDFMDDIVVPILKESAHNKVGYDDEIFATMLEYGCPSKYIPEKYISKIYAVDDKYNEEFWNYYNTEYKQS